MTNSSGTNLDSFSCPQGECLDGTSQSRSGSSLLPVRKQIAVLRANIRYIPVAHLLRKPAEAVQNMLLLFCVTNSSGTNLDSRRLPAGRVPGWHESLNCREQFWTAAGCPQGECLDGTSQSRSSRRFISINR